MGTLTILTVEGHSKVINYSKRLNLVGTPTLRKFNKKMKRLKLAPKDKFNVSST
ncbi:hypothetical protein LEP1GSC041_3266 [Leptospira noguchii str. 2006001870]|nr:hypothetical protein LEP1GSC041_3266 [Leptospira noguchii str. 2006001870]